MPTETAMYRDTLPIREHVVAAVKQIVAEQMGMSVDGIRETDGLLTEIACDSLDVIEISMEVEEHFDIHIPDELQDDVRTVGDMVDGVLRLLAEAHRSGSDT